MLVLAFCSYDELIVGAPMFSTNIAREMGRVYVYENVGVSFCLSTPVLRACMHCLSYKNMEVVS